jgi:hypothetical protein
MKTAGVSSISPCATARQSLRGKASGVQQRITGRRRKLAGRLCGIA